MNKASIIPTLHPTLHLPPKDICHFNTTQSTVQGELVIMRIVKQGSNQSQNALGVFGFH